MIFSQQHHTQSSGGRAGGGGGKTEIPVVNNLPYIRTFDRCGVPTQTANHNPSASTPTSPSLQHPDGCPNGSLSHPCLYSHQLSSTQSTETETNSYAHNPPPLSSSPSPPSLPTLAINVSCAVNFDSHASRRPNDSIPLDFCSIHTYVHQNMKKNRNKPKCWV